ncbi:hypothetical protein B0H17DRAFT_928472, partial [Mycena rosella]
MRKMVNSMSAKMEIGSPMASMYLLGYPDRYTSHRYVSFAWRPYGQFDGRFIASSGVDDYRYRPVVYNNVTLYEWIQCSDKKKHRFDDLNCEFDFEHNKPDADHYFEPGPSVDDTAYIDDEVSDWETDDEDDVILVKQAQIDKAKRPVRHAFTPEHDPFLSHSAMCRFENLTQIIPNFIGGALPRSDKGDRAAYCMTMLTLFKPWRSPMELKDSISTWDQVFRAHQFTPRQTQLMQNFNVRYECNDSRDDHFAQMKK